MNSVPESKNRKSVGGALSRYSLAAGLSVLVHFLLACYLVMVNLRQPEVLEIREINFIDETVTPQSRSNPRLGSGQQKSPKPTLKKKHNERAKLAQTRRTDPTISPSQNTDDNRIERLKKSLLTEPPEGSRIALAQSGPSDPIRVPKGTASGLPTRLASLAEPLDLGKESPLGASRPVLGLGEDHGQKNIQLGRPEVNPNPDLAESTRETSIDETGGVAFGPNKSRAVITGPLSSRKILQKYIPPFPRSARRKGVGATITLQFTVMPDGLVKENIAVVRTSGSASWDNVVVRALKRWRFAPLSRISRQAQTGAITFQFVIE